ncbi:MAG TPA: FtsX-like permease family protein [Jatrophihabitans sp.]|nr:FtsX-like permease family protein [Jatrophihabitans sp.]
MIRLALRLTLGGGREAAVRLVMITVAVAIGVGLLLTTLAGLNAVSTQNARYAWLETGATGSDAPAGRVGTGQQPLWWQLRADYYRGRLIGRVDVAATGAGSPVPPGLAALPGPGQFYASPALTALLRQVPADQLADRFPGSQIGTIGKVALPAPNTLLIVIGHTAAELSRSGDAHQVSAISTTSPNNCNGDCVPGAGINDNGIVLILSVVIAALLFPVLIFIGGATRLSAARREQRFAAMRLVGATPRQISVISTVESSLATVVGVVIGLGLFFALRPALAVISFTGSPFFISDLSLSLADVLLIAFGLPIAAAVAARLALRRVTISPLGVSRRVTPLPPRAWRLLPLLAGLGELGYFAYLKDIGANSHTNTTVEAEVFLVGILLSMVGLVVAGPWLTMLGSRLMVRHAGRPDTLIAGRRLSDNPQAGFRAISGLVLALFVGTCAVGVITTIVGYNGGAVGGRLMPRAP